MQKTLPFFSYALHPLFIPVYGLLFYFFATPTLYSFQNLYLYSIQTVILTIFIPLVFYFLLASFNKIDSIMVPKINQRKIPLILQSLLLAVLIQHTITIDNLPELHYFYLATIISNLIALVLLYFGIKASLHLLGISSLTIFCIGCSIHFEYQAISLISILIATNGLVATSRLYLKAHTPTELILGGIIGVLPQIILLPVWL